ncbi:hypothetical protein C1N53_13470 [Pontibacter sp. SGAir0037]|nr:hypothetical protein C1N53_13470 [Pontibacter sp. SGAir0037]
MTVIEKKNLWPYLMVRLIAIVLLVVPVCAGISITITDYIFSIKSTSSFKLTDFYLGWGYTFIYGTWSFFLFVLLPYSLIYVYTQVGQIYIYVRLLLFYVLLMMMGTILPHVSVIGLAPYPKSLMLSLLLTITICPLVNIPLNKMVRKRDTTN